MRYRAQLRRIYAALIIGCICVIFLLPIIWGALSSIKTPDDVIRYPPQLFGFTPSGSNYTTVLAGATGRALVTSILYSLGGTAVAISIATVAGYALDRMRFAFRRTVEAAVIGCIPLSMGAATLVIPNYLYFAGLHLTNHWFTLPLIYVGLVTPLATWIMKGAIHSVPPELDEAAQVDGASRFRILLRVILPLCRPGMFAAALFAFIGCWNEFIAGSVMVSNADLRPIQLTIYQYISVFGREWGPLTASAMLALIPIVLIVIFGGRHLITGLGGGALKG